MRCRCVDCFIKFCATQTIFQRRRYAEQTGYKSTGTMTSARRSSPPCYPIPDFLSFSRSLVARGHAANPRVVYLRKCILTWPAGDYNRAQSYRYGDRFARINSRVVHRNRWTFVSSICFFFFCCTSYVLEKEDYLWVIISVGYDGTNFVAVLS